MNTIITVQCPRRVRCIPTPNQAAPAEQDLRPTSPRATSKMHPSDASNSHRTSNSPTPMMSASGGPISRSAKSTPQPISVASGGTYSPAAKHPAPPQEPTSPATKRPTVAKTRSSRGTQSAGRHVTGDLQSATAAGTNSRSAMAGALPMEGSPSGLNVPDPAATARTQTMARSLLGPAPIGATL